MSSRDGVVRGLLAEQAINLGRLLCQVLTHGADAQALLALMLLQHSRRDARYDADGALVLLPDQDRSLWDSRAISEGVELVNNVFTTGAGHSRYAIQAAIAALHAQAVEPEDTDWKQIARLYGYLAQIDPSPVVELNRAVAIAETDGPRAALAHLQSISESPAMQRYHLYHSARADFHRRLGERVDALAAYELALQHVGNDAERQFLDRQIASL